jgi:hypothetical protein
MFVKAYHNRVYSYSSGTKFKIACADLKKWFDKRQKLWDTFEDGVSTHHPTIPTSTLLIVCLHTRKRYHTTQESS